MVFLEREFIPTIRDIENEEVKKLARRLKEKSIKESLTNIVEWQEKNLTYWIARDRMFSVACIFLITFPILVLLRRLQSINKVYTISHVGFFILAGLIFIFIYLSMEYKTLKRLQQDFDLIDLKDIFVLSISVDKILKYRLAICKEYAKLTAALLLNIYPKSKIYFIIFKCPGHSAAAIEFNNKIYVLD